MDVDGTHQHRLTLPPGIQPCEFSWSPDGKEIAMGANGGIWLIGTDGTGFRPLSPNCTLVGGCVPAIYQNPAWRGDGTMLAFDGMVSSTQNSVSVIRRDGSGFVTLTVTSGGYSTAPQWSPDGQRLAFQLFDPADHVHVLPLVFATVDTSLQGIVYGRPGIGAATPRWRP
jgi:Tol biopolymer transport system component